LTGDLLLGLGFVAIVEGLVLALAPGHLERALAFVAAMDPERRRTIGLLAVTVGVGLVWLARS
jgi:uncharacterized protein YjeT (DUF2065 family)